MRHSQFSPVLESVESRFLLSSIEPVAANAPAVVAAATTHEASTAGTPASTTPTTWELFNAEFPPTGSYYYCDPEIFDFGFDPEMIYYTDK